MTLLGGLPCIEGFISASVSKGGSSSTRYLIFSKIEKLTCYQFFFISHLFYLDIDTISSQIDFEKKFSEWYVQNSNKVNTNDDIYKSVKQWSFKKKIKIRDYMSESPTAFWGQPNLLEIAMECADSRYFVLFLKSFL